MRPVIGHLLALVGLCALVIGLFAQPVGAAEVLPGPFTAEVLRVIDADTVEVDVAVWPGQRVRVAVRVAGIDTPEKRRADCPVEKRWGLAASSFVGVWLSPGTAVTLTNVRTGKFAGRVVADIHRRAGGENGATWRSLADILVERRQALPYDGRGPRPDWCALLARPDAPKLPEL